MPEATPLEIDAIETKLAAARTRLILDKPFLGALVMRLPLTAADASWCPTTATDASKLYYNPAFIDSLSMEQTQFMLGHEALHCALSHFTRRQHREKPRWDLACDYAINPLLLEDGLEPPPECEIFGEFHGMTAEEIYPLLRENEDKKTIDRHLFDPDNDGSGNGGQPGDNPQRPVDQRESSDEDAGEGQQEDEREPQNVSPEQQDDQQPEEEGESTDQDNGDAGPVGHRKQQAESSEPAGEQPQPHDEEQPSDRNAGDGGPTDRRNQQGDGVPHLQNAPPDGQGDDPQASGSAANDSGTDGDQQGQGGDAPPPLSNEQRETLEVQWQQRLAGAAQQARQAGKLGASMARLIDHLLQPQLPWRMMLARYMTAVARDDFSYTRPSRREGSAILPSLKSAGVELAVAVDTSGSIRSEEINEFLTEVSALKGQLRARVSLLACDDQLSEESPLIFESWEEFCSPDELHGGGGTDFRPVFEWIELQGRDPELLIYFTDACGRFPQREPNYPVLWLVKGKEHVPWGQRIQLN